MKPVLIAVLAAAVALAAADGAGAVAIRPGGATAGGVRGSGGTGGSAIIATTTAGGGTGIGTGIIPDDPEIQHATYRKKAEDDFNAAAKAKAAGDLETATRLFIGVADLSKMGVDSPYPARAFEELQAIGEQAAKELAVARSQLGGADPAAGLAELKRIVRVYSGLPPAKQAGALAIQLDADPQFQASLRAARLAQDLKKAEALEAAAAPGATARTGSEPPTGPAAKALTDKQREALRLSRLVEAYETYGRIVDQGGTTDPAKAAAAAIARLQQDKDLMARLTQAQAEGKARQYLGLAQNYFKAGLTARAQEYCQKILTECPSAPQAADAQAILDKMK